jgi:molybdenum cofactor cytidylyltransferase
MASTLRARPELLGGPRLSGRGIFHVHLRTAALTPNLKTEVDHAPDCRSVCSRARYDAQVLAPIVIAAGQSTRMGRPKALLRDDAGRTFVARVVKTLSDGGLTGVTVVTGTHHEAIASALEEDLIAVPYRLARNPDPGRGQLSSIWTGMDAAVNADTTAIVLMLVDVPFVSSTTVRTVVDAYRRSGAPIVRPAIGDRHGHPVVFDRSLFADLRSADPAVGAKSVVRAHETEIVNVQVDDEGAVRDIDTPADYADALKSAGRRAGSESAD